MTGRHSSMPGEAPRVFPWWLDPRPRGRRAVRISAKAAVVTLVGVGLPLVVHTAGTFPETGTEGLSEPPTPAPGPAPEHQSVAPEADAADSAVRVDIETDDEAIPVKYETVVDPQQWGPPTSDTTAPPPLAPTTVVAAPAPVVESEPATTPEPEPEFSLARLIGLGGPGG